MLSALLALHGAAGVGLNELSAYALPEGTYELTPLMVAAATGSARAALALLQQHGVDAGIASARGRTAAHEAAGGDCTGTILRALPAAAAIAAVAKGGVRPAHVACEAGHDVCLSVIAAHAERDVLFAPVRGGWTVAHFAAANGRARCLSLLLEIEPCCALAGDKFDRTPAHLAGASGHAACVRQLGADAAIARDIDGRTALHCAAFAGHVACLRECLALGGASALALCDHEGQGALHYAARCRSAADGAQCVAFLVDALGEAALAALDDAGRTPAALLRARCERECAEAEGKDESKREGAQQWRPASIACKRWQREVFLNASVAPLRIAELEVAAARVKAEVGSANADAERAGGGGDLDCVCFILDDVGICATSGTAAVRDPLAALAAALPPAPGVLRSTEAACAGDIVRLGLAPPQLICVPNPSAAARRALLASVPALGVVDACCGDALASLARARAKWSAGALTSHRGALAAVWLDYCDAIDGHVGELATLFSGGVLRATACVCLTVSWRGARSARVGRHKDGAAFMARYAASLEETVLAAAAAGGYELTRVIAPTQCGQLFYLAYQAARRTGAFGVPSSGVCAEPTRTEAASTLPVLCCAPRAVQLVRSALTAARWVPLRFNVGGRHGVAVIDAERLSIVAVEGSSSALDWASAKALPITAAAASSVLAAEGVPAELAALFASDQACLRFVAVAKVRAALPRSKQRSAVPPDHTVHPERCPRRQGECTPLRLPRAALRAVAQRAAFTFIELFAGIGGFRVGLEPLGGRCVFASELDTEAGAVYARNAARDAASNTGFNTARSAGVRGGASVESGSGAAAAAAAAAVATLALGDIRDVDIARAIPSHDLLTGGFPCQPFSTLGEQSGIASAGGKGALFETIVAVLRIKQPRAFLLENVPGLLSCDGGKAMVAIVAALEGAGYNVTHELVNSRCLTAQARNRLYLVGVRRCAPAPTPTATTTAIAVGAATTAAAAAAAAAAATRAFVFPHIPDLGLRASDVLEPEALLRARGAAAGYTLNAMQMEQLEGAAAWRRRGASSLAWPGAVCRAVISHYGRSVGRGASQLVPRAAPHNPRCFTARECARLMGFPEHFALVVSPRAGAFDASTQCARKGPGAARSHHIGGLAEDARRGLYRMVGNAVCPPVIAALAGAVLEHVLPPRTGGYREGALNSASKRAPEGALEGNGERTIGWRALGEAVAVDLALAALRPLRFG